MEFFVYPIVDILFYIVCYYHPDWGLEDFDTVMAHGVIHSNTRLLEYSTSINYDMHITVPAGVNIYMRRLLLLVILREVPYRMPLAMSFWLNMCISYGFRQQGFWCRLLWGYRDWVRNPYCLALFRTISRTCFSLKPLNSRNREGFDSIIKLSNSSGTRHVLIL